MSFSRLFVEWMVFWSWVFPSRLISLALLMRGDDSGGWFNGINGFLECFCIVYFCHVFFYWFMVYAPGRSRVRKAEWREVQAESLPIKQDSSAKDSTGRVEVRTKDKNAMAGRLRRKGKADRTQSR